MRTAFFVPAALVAVALVLGGCGGDDDKSKEAAKTAAEPAPAVTDRERGTSETDSPRQARKPRKATPPAPSPSRPARREGPEAKRVRATLSTFFAGMRKEDARQVCSTFTKQTSDLVGGALGTSCAGGMKYAFGLVPDGAQEGFGRIRVRRVKVSGRNARVKLALPKELLAIPTLQFIARKQILNMRKERGEWRVGLPSL